MGGGHDHATTTSGFEALAMALLLLLLLAGLLG